MNSRAPAPTTTQLAVMKRNTILQGLYLFQNMVVKMHMQKQTMTISISTPLTAHFSIMGIIMNGLVRQPTTTSTIIHIMHYYHIIAWMDPFLEATEALR